MFLLRGGSAQGGDPRDGDQSKGSGLHTVFVHSRGGIRTMEFETLATGYGLLEGPRTDEQNRLYFSDVRGGGVFRRNPDGRIDTLIPERKSVGGIALNQGGGMIVTGLGLAHCAEAGGRIRDLF